MRNPRRWCLRMKTASSSSRRLRARMGPPRHPGGATDKKDSPVSNKAHTRQGKARQGKARQGKARQGKARHVFFRIHVLHLKRHLPPLPGSQTLHERSQKHLHHAHCLATQRCELE
jgi:hypothetical protein